MTFIYILLVLALLVELQPAKAQQQNCDAAYAEVCIAPLPPDLDCGETSERSKPPSMKPGSRLCLTMGGKQPSTVAPLSAAMLVVKAVSTQPRLIATAPG
jgi:hypothetical protein